VRFDDRLSTVLDSPADDARDRAVRWRQLVELVARSAGDASGDLLERAVREIRDGAASVDEQVRTASARAVAQLSLPLQLICAFAADRMSVAAPILASARLTAFEWGQVLAGASSECRRFIQALRSEAADGVSPPATSKEPEIQHHPIPSISEVVARIERLRQSREPAAEAEAVQPPESEEGPAAARLFRWECDENGQIAWVEGVPRGPLIGCSIAHLDEDALTDRQVERAFAAKIPFHDALLQLAEGTPVEGAWTISGTPAFDPATGRFEGYRGIAERNVPAPDNAEAMDTAADPDSLRDLAHEIRTPLNAIIGFAEIISGQYLGPAHHPYRERAAEIAAQAHLLLTAIEDLDFAAKLGSRSTDQERRIHLGALAERVVPILRGLAETRDVRIEASRATRDLEASVDPELAERLVTRMCSGVIERAIAGECLQISVDNGGEDCRISISRPKALLGLSEAELFGSADKMPSQSFTLRLSRGLASMAGAQLIASESQLSLVFRKAPLGAETSGVYF